MKEYLQSFQEYMSENGLKNTAQRTLIVEVFMTAKGHLSVEQMYDAVRKIDPSVGQATVYRSMKLLCDAGLAHEVQFGDGITRYEPQNKEHHDHLICEKCGKTIEIMNKKIEKLQESIAEKHGFVPTNHVLCLYGICSDCQKKAKPKLK